MDIRVTSTATVTGGIAMPGIPTMTTTGTDMTTTATLQAEGAGTWRTTAQRITTEPATTPSEGTAVEATQMQGHVARRFSLEVVLAIAACSAASS